MEYFSEFANTIITQLHDFLNQKFEKQKRGFKKNYIFVDNHSTNKSYLFLAYCQLSISYFIVCEEIEVIFYISGHSHSKIDQSHSILKKNTFVP